MKAQLRSITGDNKGEIQLPEQFKEEVRPDLIKRAVIAQRSHKIQQHGTDPEAGKKYSSKLSRRRRNYKTAYGIGISRISRKILSHRGSRFNWQALQYPTQSAEEMHTPQNQKKKWARKINRKERIKAIRSAMAASVIKSLVEERGHIVQITLSLGRCR